MTRAAIAPRSARHARAGSRLRAKRSMRERRSLRRWRRPQGQGVRAEPRRWRRRQWKGARAEPTRLHPQRMRARRKRPKRPKQMRATQTQAQAQQKRAKQKRAKQKETKQKRVKQKEPLLGPTAPAPRQRPVRGGSGAARGPNPGPRSLPSYTRPASSQRDKPSGHPGRRRKFLFAVHTATPTSAISNPGSAGSPAQG